MSLPLLPTLAAIVGVEPGRDVEWFDVSPYHQKPDGIVPISDYRLSVFGCYRLDWCG